MKKYYRLAVAALTVCAALNAAADIPLSYYSSIQGLCGAELKNALYELVGNDPDIKMLSYGSGNLHTWWGFYITDRNEDNSVVDRYSNDIRYFTSQGSSVSGMNIEHSFPKSWWGGYENNAYKDLYNLMPCEAKINSTKSNYPMGVVTRPTAAGNNGCTRVGAGEWDGNWWEPADKWKGDFARGYMYMATAYQQFTYSSAQAKQIISTGAYPTLLPRASELYIKWALEDDVTEAEALRNDRVQNIQGNRNPFVDFPNLMEYIWGELGVYADRLAFTRKSAPAYGVIDGTGGAAVVIYDNTLLGDDGGFTEEMVNAPASGYHVWTNTAQYGWKGTSFSGGAVEAVADLVGPETDLSQMVSARMSFEHAVNYASVAPGEQFSVFARDENGVDTPLDVPAWPAGNSWKFNSSGNVSLDAFAGKKIRIVFRYVSDNVKSPTWEIRNLKISGQKRISGIEMIQPGLDPDDNKSCPAEYYTLDGRRVDPSSYRGIVIRRQGTYVTKELLR